MVSMYYPHTQTHTQTVTPTHPRLTRSPFSTRRRSTARPSVGACVGLTDVTTAVYSTTTTVLAVDESVIVLFWDAAVARVSERVALSRWTERSLLCVV